MVRSLSLVFVLAAACGGKKQPTTTTPAAAGSGDAERKEMATLPPELSKFHEVLAPRWHAEKGPQRMKDTCTAVPELHADADALAKTIPPRGANADTWTTGTKRLVDAVIGLDTACKANDATAFEPAFQKVHEGFHALLGASGMHDEGKEGHEAHEGAKHHEM